MPFIPDRKTGFIPDEESPSTPFFERAASQNEALIRSRENPYTQIQEAILNPSPGVRGSPLQALQTILPLMQVAESVPANIGLGIQQRRGVGQTARDVLSGLKGERTAELGDIARASGLPIVSSRPVASTLGLLATLGLGGPKVAKGVQTTGELAAQRAIRPVTETLGLLKLGAPSTFKKPNIIREGVLENIREGLLKAPKLAGQEFEHGLNQLVSKSPDTIVDLSEAVQLSQAATQRNPAFATLLRGSSKNNQQAAMIQSVLSNPDVASTLTLKQAQEVKQVLQRSLTQKFKQVAPEYLDAHLDALDVWHTIRAAELKAFPQFEKVLQGYNQALSNFRALKFILSKASLEPALLNNLNGRTELIQAFRELATPDTMALVKKFQQSTGTVKFLKRLGLIAGTGAAFEVGRRSLGTTAGRVLGAGVNPPQ